MGKIIKTEFLKLKRYSVIKAGIIMTVLSPLLSLFYSTANGGQTWTFDYFMQQVMISNCTLFFPIIIALIAGYIITREYTDDTMKNPERISDFQSSDIPVIDQVIGKMAADTKHRLELSDVHNVRILRKHHQVQFSQLRLFHCHSSATSSFFSVLE